MAEVIPIKHRLSDKTDSEDCRFDLDAFIAREADILKNIFIRNSKNCTNSSPALSSDSGISSPQFARPKPQSSRLDSTTAVKLNSFESSGNSTPVRPLNYDKGQTTASGNKSKAFSSLKCQLDNGSKKQTTASGNKSKAFSSLKCQLDNVGKEPTTASGNKSKAYSSLKCQLDNVGKEPTTASGNKSKAYSSLKCRLDNFCQLKKTAMCNLVQELKYVKSFMDDADSKHFINSGDEVRNCSWSAEEANDWFFFLDIWDSTKKNICFLIVKIRQVFLNFDSDFSIAFEKLNEFLDSLLIAFEDLQELNNLYHQGVTKFKRFCLYYEDYVFLIHAFSVKTYGYPLQDKLGSEYNEFSLFVSKIDNEILLIDGKSDSIS